MLQPENVAIDQKPNLDITVGCIHECVAMLKLLTLSQFRCWCVPDQKLAISKVLLCFFFQTF